MSWFPTSTTSSVSVECLNILWKRRTSSSQCCSHTQTQTQARLVNHTHVPGEASYEIMWSLRVGPAGPEAAALIPTPDSIWPLKERRPPEETSNYPAALRVCVYTLFPNQSVCVDDAWLPLLISSEAVDSAVLMVDRRRSRRVWAPKCTDLICSSCFKSYLNWSDLEIYTTVNQNNEKRRENSLCRSLALNFYFSFLQSQSFELCLKRPEETLRPDSQNFK